MRKKLKILIFSKMAPMILIKFCEFIVQTKHNNMTLSAFPGKFPEAVKINLTFLYFTCVSYQPKKKMFCSRKHNRDHRLLINEDFIEIDPVVLEL